MTNMQRASNLEIAQEIVIFMMMVLSSVRPKKGPTQHRGRAASELLATVPDYGGTDVPVALARCEELACITPSRPASSPVGILAVRRGAATLSQTPGVLATCWLYSQIAKAARARLPPDFGYGRQERCELVAGGRSKAVE